MHSRFIGPPVPSLLASFRRHSGRCKKTGQITSRHRGGGLKYNYRIIDFTRDRGAAGKYTVLRLEKDPNRTAWIALLKRDGDSVLSYVLAWRGCAPGDVVYNGDTVSPSLGNCLPLKAIPPGTLVHNIGIRAGEAGKLARSAGTYGQILSSSGSYVQIKLCSGEIRYIHSEARATVGAVSNPFHKLEILGTAGANRRKGIRPHVRGVAMNPCDHPMGGKGKGRGMPSTSPWGKITKGKFTVKKHLQKYVIKPRPTRNPRKKQLTSSKYGKFAVDNEELKNLMNGNNDGFFPASSNSTGLVEMNQSSKDGVSKVKN